ncbi:hypothetical protein GSI_02772 [Ganoderma sinense ZZ0214-1]|uniref:Uncharacterized protein n=1 Tax=Ganoderma sinense ZZ0214-1 TaxID=1077348 RepID=A0A2G8SMJ2_9APHY|nr:hypothetical protein GSI_02772 [Ganoderma sinense ZZ0214-1]
MSAIEPRQTRSSRLRDTPKASSVASPPTNEHSPPSRSPSPGAKRAKHDGNLSPSLSASTSSTTYGSDLTTPSSLSTLSQSSADDTRSSSSAIIDPLVPEVDTRMPSPSSVNCTTIAPLHPPPLQDDSATTPTTIATSSSTGPTAVATITTDQPLSTHASLSSPVPNVQGDSAHYSADDHQPHVGDNANTAINNTDDPSGDVAVTSSVTSDPDRRPEPPSLTRVCQETGEIVCTDVDRLRAQRVLVDSWIPEDTIERLRQFGEYANTVSPGFCLSRIPCTATWGRTLPSGDVSGLLCVDNRPLTAYIAGTVIKKWFTDYQGTLQTPVKICIRPCRAIDLAAANHWLSQAKPPAKVNLDCFWASRIMLEWPDDLDADKPETVAFTDIYDSTNPSFAHDDNHRRTSRFFDVGDIVLVEVLVTRFKPKGYKGPGWGKYKVGYELKTIDVIARNPIRPNAYSRPSLPTRSFNL